ncbi:MAG: cobyrinate a,c-diamide synthase [Pseudomonadota bacterium]
MPTTSPKGLVIAAPSSGSGKTLVTLGLLRALAKAGHNVGSAKAGPDYIDPRFHEAATGRPCVNLDAWAMPPQRVAAIAAQAAEGRDLLVIEGVMGLFDGAETGEGSTADLAGLLGFPIILVVDSLRQSQSAAALVRGFAHHRADCRIAGVIFNKVATDRHEGILRTAMDPLGIPVLGCVRNVYELEVPSRHLGLVQASEHESLERFIETAADLVAAALDLDRLSALAHGTLDAVGPARAVLPLGQKIAVADDKAFAFSYPHLLNGWREAGAELSLFSPLNNEAPAQDADAIYLPGGYPELHAGTLAGNGAFLDGLRAAAARDALIYGECGGFMVLGEGLTDADGERHRMCDLLSVVTSFEKRKLHLGYRRLQHQGPLPFGKMLRGHEFHYSTLISHGDGEALFKAEDAAGRDLGEIGLRSGTVMGSYAHIIDQERAP